MFFPNALAEANYDATTIIPKDVTVIEFEKYNIVRILIEAHNSDTQKMSPLYTNLVIGDTFYEKQGTFGGVEQVGSGTCPFASMDVEPKSVEEYVLCFKLPKIQLDTYSLHLSDSGIDYCNNVPEYCQQKNYGISESITPVYTDYESFYQKTFIYPLQAISAELTNAGIREKDDLNVVHATFSITNEGNEEFNGPSDVHLENAKGQQFDFDYAFFSDCSGGTEINPGLTKSTTYCFEIPKNQYEFEIVVRHNFPWTDDCDNINIVKKGSDEQCEEERFNLEIGSSAAPTTTTSSAAPTTTTFTTQQTGSGCGEGTVLINGVCQLSEDVDVTGQNAFNAIAGFIVFGIISIIAIIIIIIIIAILIKRRGKKRKTKTKDVKPNLENNDNKQVLDPYIEDKPEMSETVKRIKAKHTLHSRNTFCEECGAQLRILQKFCGKCGARVNN